MKILMLSTDQNIFKSGSEVQRRMIEYGGLCEELHIVVYSKRPTTNDQRPIMISKNVWAYATNTRFKPFYFWDAYRVACSILRKSDLHREVGLPQEWLITSQDVFETGLVGYWLGRKFGLPLQIQIHTDFLSPYFWRESFKNKIRVLLGKWLVKKALRPPADESRQAVCLRVVSERIKDSLTTLYPALSYMIAVLPIFVDVERIKSAPIKTDLHKKYPGHDFIILMASRLTREKNIPMAIKAIAEIKRQSPACRQAGTSDKRQVLLLVVGDGPEKNNLRLTTNNLQLEQNVKFEEWTDALASYYKTADVFLNPSDYEGYGRTIIEALAVGCPVISTDVGIAPEFIKSEKFGKLIKPNDLRGLIGVLKEAIEGKYRRFEGLALSESKNDYLKRYKQALECVPVAKS